MKQWKSSKNNRSWVMLLALLATFLLSVPVCSALYQVDVRLNPPGIYLGSETQVSIQVSDTDNPGWVFPNATVNITLSNQTGSNTTIPYNKTDSNGLLLFPYIPGSTGNYTLVASSTYDYNTTQYIQDGNQSATSSPVTLNVSYKPGKIGVFRNSTQKFYLDRNGNGAWNGASVDRQYNFGLNGDIPIFGEWNGTTVTEIGVFRPSTHLFYLDYNGNGAWNGASVDRQYNFGLTGDIPVPGDWTLEGRTKIGVFRPSTHLFYLDYNGNGAWNGAFVDKQYNFGLTGDIPVSGDWNSNGITEIGVFRNSTHMFYLDYNGNGIWDGGVTDRQYNFGLAGDFPVSGDWNLDGRTEIGVFRNATHLFYLDYNGNGAWNGASVDRQYNFGLTGDRPVTGDWK